MPRTRLFPTRSVSKLLFALLLSVFSALGQDSPAQAGIADYRAGNYESSIEKLSKVVLANENDRIAWLYLGAAQLRSGNVKEANKAFKKSGSRDKAKEEQITSELKILSKSPARYTQAARENGITGTVRLIIEFRSDGQIGFVHVFQGLPYGITEQCIDSASRIRFQPAEIAGNPVTVLRQIEYSFNIY